MSGTHKLRWKRVGGVTAYALTVGGVCSYDRGMDFPFGIIATTPDIREIRAVYVWGAILIGMMLAAFFAYSYFKKWMNDTGSADDAGFTLSDLRKLREQGKISAEEFEQTRANMMAAAKRMTDKMPDVIQRRPPSAP